MTIHRNFIVTNNIKSDEEIRRISNKLGELAYAVIEQANEPSFPRSQKISKISFDMNTIRQ